MKEINRQGILAWTGDRFHSIGVYNEQEDISIAVSVNGSTIPFSEFLLGIFDSIYGK